MVGVRGESQRTQHHGCPPPREERRVGQTEHRFPSLGGHGRHGGYREGRHLHLLCPQLSPSSSSTPRGHPGGATPTDCGPGRGARLSAGAGQAAQGVEPARPAGGLPRGGSGLPAPRPARPGGGGGNAGASSPRPAARPHTPPAAGSHPARRPAAPRHERRRWLQAESLPPRPPLAPVRRHYSLFAASGGDGEGPERGCPAPPRPPSVPPALSGSCLLLLLLLPVVQAPPSLLSFAARISLEFYSLPHVTHRVKLHLRRVTHQHSASPSRPGHRQQQPPPTEDSQPGSQPAPPSAECAAAAHGNSRARSGGARAAPPSALKAEVAEDLRVPSGAAEGFLRERESGGREASLRESAEKPGGRRWDHSISGDGGLGTPGSWRSLAGQRGRPDPWGTPWASEPCPALTESSRLLCPWNFPGKNTGVSCHGLLQKIFLTQRLNPCFLHCLNHRNPPKYCLLVGPDFSMVTLPAISVLVLYNLKEMKTSLKLSDLPTFRVRTEELISKILVASYFYFEDQLLQLYNQDT
ncbi:uncharacterized protein ACBT57_015065 [Dama dama]